MATNNFKYTALHDKEIRLLVLDAGKEGDALSGALIADKYIPSEHVMKYEALSYTWGDQSNPDYIHLRNPKLIAQGNSCICDKIPSGSLAIGYNLALALRYLRHKDNSQTL
ncbi:hypothetical protein NOF04DRAFT_1363403 [Fusarium oxysporum II5]|uniref:Uncharacterized protein n=4 Tax=Fusarium oxysporum species complex TaxID=171631 RepID=N1RRS8_FUSC4|nr:uncharacterized protein FOIG_16819 [Fusarium odoratissimum NRRL 54006]EMT66842.1 hypothetical protein FOC4_g10000053 [Fusarium odoratissimum]ENH68235.1 hypothetical protein FOC1_g10000600 [Fusarium oxysporum f. sp. cubense race 1]KAK2122112.1 hypothetical protein NOF04DRAFT_9484 [Fusarium oxysporum II5]TXB97918.1 hypothetical protein FocTR4_00017037 [Fusarium oxysporum f. sp. cubense]EXL89899.1 hypothetical protein FOIG_16819 [Fusarium odoratissimum NRRL 54006]